MLLGASTAILSSLVIAKLCHYDVELINSGLYGYNAALVGIAVFFFLPLSLPSLILVIFGGALSSSITHLFLGKLNNSAALPIFTAPFIISIWTLLLIDRQIAETLASDIILNPVAVKSFNDGYVIMRGVAQVMFQDYWLSGVIFTAGLLLHSYKVAIWAVIGSAMAMIIARTFNFSDDLILMGLYGFNASLTAIALAEHYSKRYYRAIWPICVGIVLSVLFAKGFQYIEIPALTAPFVLASWIVISSVKITVNKYP